MRLRSGTGRLAGPSCRGCIEPEIAQYPKSTEMTTVVARGGPVPIRSSHLKGQAPAAEVEQVLLEGRGVRLCMCVREREGGGEREEGGRKRGSVLVQVVVRLREISDRFWCSLP